MSSRSIEKRIGYSIAELPSKAFLGLELTDEQQAEYQRYNTEIYWVSQCWNARFSGNPDPLEEIKTQLSSKAERDWKDMIWLRVDKLTALWALIQTGWKVIKATALKKRMDFYFTSPAQLFIEAVRGMEDSKFEVCLLPYVEISNKKYETSARGTLKLMQSRLEGDDFLQLTSEKERAQARKNGDHNWLRLFTQNGNGWEFFSIYFCSCACRATPQGTRLLKIRLEDLTQCQIRLNDWYAKKSRQRGVGIELSHPSFAWSNGQRVYSSPNKTYGGLNKS